MAHPAVVGPTQRGAERAWHGGRQRDAGGEKELLVQAFQSVPLQSPGHVVPYHLAAGERTASPVLPGVVHVVVVIGLRTPLTPGALPFPPGLEPPLVGLSLFDAHRRIRLER